MLGKLLKHEFAFIGRVAIPVCGGTLALSVIVRVLFEFLANASSDRMDTTLPFISTITLCVFALLAMYVGLFIVMVVRQYRHVYGREGYLLHTLPVTADQIIFSKLIVWVTVSIAQVGVFLASVFILFQGLNAGFEPIDIIGQIPFMFSSLVNEPDSAVMVTLYLFQQVVGMVSAFTTLFASISLGHSTKHRLWVTIGIYVGAQIAISTVSSMLAMIIMAFGMSNGVGNGMSYLTISTLVSTIFSAVICGVGYFISRHILKNKLNLT